MDKTPNNNASLITPVIELKGIRKTFVLSDDKNAQKVLVLDGDRIALIHATACCHQPCEESRVR